MKKKLEPELPEGLEQQEHQFTVLQSEITIASDKENDLIKVCSYMHIYI